MATSAGVSKRAQADLRKLIAAGEYRVEVEETASTSARGCLDFMVRQWRGPPDSLYQDGAYDLAIHLPADYPFRSPSVGFRTRIFHPNVDERSGSVCLDVINQCWSPMYDLSNILTAFLPQLLLYGNPADPLNPEAAAMQLRDPDAYRARVKEHTAKYASPTSSGTTAAAASSSAGGKPEARASGAQAAQARTASGVLTGSLRGSLSGGAGAGHLDDATSLSRASAASANAIKPQAELQPASQERDRLGARAGIQSCSTQLEGSGVGMGTGGGATGQPGSTLTAASTCTTATAAGAGGCSSSSGGCIGGAGCGEDEDDDDDGDGDSDVSDLSDL